MPKANEKLADALEILHQAQDVTKKKVFKSDELPRVARERLVRSGFLSEVTRGWLYITRPDGATGDTTPWIASFWEFISLYANHRFENEWVLSAEQSILLFTEDSSIPKQLILHASSGKNNVVNLPFGGSIFDLKSVFSIDDVEDIDGIRRMKLTSALMRVKDDFFKRHPLAATLALNSIRSSSQLLTPLLDAGASVVAGRLAGALRHIGKEVMANDIVETMRQAGHNVRENNPFSQEASPIIIRSGHPIVGRLSGLWHASRQQVIDMFPAMPGIPIDIDQYMEDVDESYKSDAYHSLSIEGYSVTPELIERVRSGEWGVEENKDDIKALAARGYYEAFQLTRNSLISILNGDNPGDVVEKDHNGWYRAMFTPSVTAGLIKSSDLAGYRNHPVYLLKSDYVPPRAETVVDGMETLFDLIREEPEASVRAVLGHWLWGYIHPFPDGNGRTGRFLFNTMLASGGYPWTIIKVEDRNEYLEGLDRASIDGNVEPFTNLLARRVEERLASNPVLQP